MGLGISTTYPDSVESIQGLPIAGGYNRVSNPNSVQRLLTLHNRCFLSGRDFEKIEGLIRN